MTNLPSGTVTFLFTDIEGSTERWEAHPDAMRDAFARQEEILRHAIEANRGYAYKLTGNAFQAAFATAPQAIQAAIDAQRALEGMANAEFGMRNEPAPDTQDLGSRIRMALHTGVTEEREGDYSGPLLNRVARLLSAGHGGQVLLTHATRQLLSDDLPDGVILRDMGEHRLKDLIRPEHIFQLIVPDLPSEFPPLKTLDGRPNNLPLQATLFVGREQDVAAVRERMLRPDVQLLTLTGAGGIGKTRLALQVAAELLDDFPDGVFFINLALLVEPAQVIPTTAHTLGLRETGGYPLADTLKDYLREKRLLLVLDNFEQVVKAAPEIANLLKSAPHLKMVITSRAALHLSMEREYVVPPLHVPDLRRLPPPQALAQYDAVKLFMQRAQAVQPGFELNNANASAVAEICNRLEGIPLSIQLAAARVRILPPQAILARLDSRLKLLTGGARDMPARQQALRNTIEWSYDLLTAEEKELFRRIAVFRGGCTLEGAEAVCSAGDRDRVLGVGDRAITQYPTPNTRNEATMDLLDGISSLVDKSLMYVTEGIGGESRYWMLELIGEYASEKLHEGSEGRGGDRDEIQKRHALYFMKLAEDAEPELTGAGQEKWLGRLEDEHENIRAALRWTREAGGSAGDRDWVLGVRDRSITRHPTPTLGSETTEKHEAEGALTPEEIGLRTAGALWRFWYVRGYFSEGREQLEALAARSAGDRDRVLGDGDRSNTQHSTPNPGNKSPALRDEGEAAELARAQPSCEAYRAKGLNGAGVLAQQQGDYQAARSLYEESLALRRELGDKRGVAASLNNLANIAHEAGDYRTAHSLHEESLAIKRELGDKRGMAYSLHNMGNLSHREGDYRAARLLYEESLALRRELGDKWGVSASLNGVAVALQELGDYDTARSLYTESLAIKKELGDKLGIAMVLTNLGTLSHAQGDYDTARSLYEESLAIKREIGEKRGIAYSLDGLGNVALEQGDYQAARSLHEESLAIRRALGDRLGIAASLAGLAGVAAGIAAHEVTDETRRKIATRAATLLGAVDAQLEAIGGSLDSGDHILYERTKESLRTQLGQEEFEAAQAEGRATSMEVAIAYALDGTHYG